MRSMPSVTTPGSTTTAECPDRIEHSSHPLKTDDDAARRGQGAADIAGAGTAQGQCNAVFIGNAHQCDHLVMRGRKQHGFGFDLTRGFVAGVERPGGGVVKDAVGPESGTESGKCAIGQHGNKRLGGSGRMFGRQLLDSWRDHVGVEIHADVPARIQRNRHTAADAA